MHHTIDKDGPFAQACAAFLAKHGTTLYHDRLGDDDGKKRKRKAASKTKYTCLSCGSNAWAKPDINLWCGDCQEQMEPAEPPDENAD
jgi:ribosomal protein L37AE/L43A